MSYIDKLDVTQRQLRFLHKQFKTILDEKIRVALPEASDEDRVNQEVQLQLDQFLMETMEMAGESMNLVDVNKGTTVKSIIQEVQKEYTQPFDVELNEQVRQLYQEWENETVNVSKLRREAPSLAVAEYTRQEQSLLDELDSQIDKSLDSNSKELLDLKKHDRGALPAQNDEEFWKEIASQYKHALTDLYKVNDELPSHISRQDRLRLLMEYIEKEVGA